MPLAGDNGIKAIWAAVEHSHRDKAGAGGGLEAGVSGVGSVAGMSNKNETAERLRGSGEAGVD